MDAQPARFARYGLRPGWGLAGWSLVLVFAALAWRAVRYALVFPMWGDEGMLAVNFHDRTFLGLLETLDYGQVAPPGFLWLELTAAKLLGFTEPVLRAVPFLAGMAAVLLFWHLGRKLLARRAALLSMAVFAASFYPTRYAAEVKPYSLDLFLALALILTAWAVYERPTAGAGGSPSRPSLPSRCGSRIRRSSSAAGRACGCSRFDLSDSEPPRWGRVLASGALIGSSFLAMYVLAGSGQRAAAPASYWSAGFPPMSEPWKIPIWLLDVHTGMMMAYPNGGHSGGSVVSFALAVIGGVVLWRTRRPVLLLLLSPVPLMLFAAALQKYPYGASARVAQHIAPAACLLDRYGDRVRSAEGCWGRGGPYAPSRSRCSPSWWWRSPGSSVTWRGRTTRRPTRSFERRSRGLAASPNPGIAGSCSPAWTGRGLAPGYSRFVGMGGRIHFQILSRVPGPVLWGAGSGHWWPRPAVGGRG